jgi:peptidoglycan/LPS O-acetylase OafA/YrhL
VSIFAASLPFSLGSLLFFYKPEVFRIINQLRISSPIVLLSIYILNAILFILFRHHFGEIGKYTNLLLSLLVITSLFYKGGEIFNYKLDKVVGDYSYPIYLLHYQCGVVASFILYKSPNRALTPEGITSFLLAFFLVLVISFILIQLVDKNITLIRNKIRTSL